MKKATGPIAFFMTLVMLFSVCSLTAFAEPIQLPGGQIEDGIYTNTEIGMKFSCPEGWSLSSDEELAKENGISVSELLDESVINRFMDEKKQFTIMAANGKGSGIAPGIKLDYLPVTEEEAKEIEENGMEAYLSQEMSFEVSDSQSRAKVTDSKVEICTFLGEEIPVLRMKMKILLIFSTEIDVLIFSRNDRFYSLMITGADDVSQYLSMFENI